MPSVDIELLDAKRPEWSLYSDAWTQFDVLHAGGARFKLQAQEFLTKRPKELLDVYNERIRRVTYQNILGTALGWYAATLFRRNPEIDINPEGADSWYGDFLQDCNRAGTTYVDFWRAGFLNLALYRSVYVLTDAPRPAKEPASRADETDMGLDKPYVVMYDPRQVINQSCDEYGNLNWIVIKTARLVNTFLQPSKLETIWYYFDRQEYRVYRAEGEMKSLTGITVPVQGAQQDAQLIDQGTHALARVNRVPVRCIEIPDALWLANRVYMQLTEHLNTENALSWGLFLANLAMPIIFSDRDLTNPTIAEAAWLQLGATDRFEWSEPEGRSFEVSARRLESLREEIYRTMYLSAQGRNASASASAQSGLSKQMDMMPANDALNGFGDIVRQGMQDVLLDVAAAHGDATTTFDVRGFRFETKPATESIALNQEAQALGIPSPTLEKELDKRTAADLIEDANEDLKKKIAREIEAAPTREEKEQQLQMQQAQAMQKSFQTLNSRAAVKGEQNSLAAA